MLQLRVSLARMLLVKLLGIGLMHATGCLCIVVSVHWRPLLREIAL